MDNKAKTANNGSDNDLEGQQEENPNNNNDLTEQVVAEEPNTGSNLNQDQQQMPSRARTPFTNLSQVDADLALARTLQEQERAYMMLRMNNDGSDYESWEAGSYLHDEDDDFGGPDDETDEEGNENEDFDGTDVEDDVDDDDEDAFDVHDHDEDAEEDNNPSVEYDSDVFSSDEAYARALQDAEEREMAARLLALAGINDREIEDPEDHGGNSQVLISLSPHTVLSSPSPPSDTWEEVDPDELSYEELLALGEVVGTESRGLSTDTLASLPTIKYKTGSSQNGSNDSCVICRLDYEDDETLTLLSCKHSYHSECINNWLKINKIFTAFLPVGTLQSIGAYFIIIAVICIPRNNRACSSVNAGVPRLQYRGFHFWAQLMLSHAQGDTE
ncbi:hypothetical protein Pint_23208 [Pistacia integerrima]|uniref:Uncharacterized protein n=1 Tax=Pistacia integerrima TaxID=434235 RepID=A0ACC0YKE8_9ROSI|nr:hypothetical protein Pint_23208 [Pistacia integerrima]